LFCGLYFFSLPQSNASVEGNVMKNLMLLASAIFGLIVLLNVSAQGQEPDVPSKIEVGLQFSSLTYSPPPIFSQLATAGRGSAEAGFGGRFTFNFNKHLALEAEGNFFPHPNLYDQSRNGRLLQGQFGLKAGKRFGKFGVFAKARPGFASFSQVLTIVGDQTIDLGGQPFTFPIFDLRRKTYFSMDLGGVLEFYPSRKVLTRIDVGDTMIRYDNQSIPFGAIFFPIPTSTSRIGHNLQVSAGIGFRFGSVPQPAIAQMHNDKQKRFELGVQFSSLSLQEIERCSFCLAVDYRDILTQTGFGGRLTYNVTSGFAVEMQTDFYPREVRQFINNGRAGGRILQGQAGVKAGKRFEKFGIFGKARPGIVSFSEAVKVDGVDPIFGFPIFRTARKNYFSMDVGGVLEFYPAPRIITRFDGGDTMIRYSASESSLSVFPAVSNVRVPPQTTHNFQFSAGVGFRF
jgi:hypothetical protein